MGADYFSNSEEPLPKELYDCERDDESSSQSSCRTKSFHANTYSDFVAIDVEHYYPQHLTLCSIGMVKYKNGKKVDSYSSLICPPFEYPGKKGKPCTRTHHLREKDFIGQRTFDLILPEIESFAGDLPLVAHNYGTERTCLRDAAAYYGLRTKLDIDNISDTKLIAQIVENDLSIQLSMQSPYELTNVCKRFGVKVLQHHKAIDDAEMCGNLMVTFHNFLKNGITPNVFLDDEIETLKQKVLSIEPAAISTDFVRNNLFYGQRIVISGLDDDCLKKELKDRLTFLGAKVTGDVSGKTQLLICGANPGPSKMDKAEQLGIPQMDEKTLYETLLSIYDV